METFAPTQLFLRVDDKFYPDFVDLDRELRSGPTFLYVQLFRRCRQQDCCTVSQSQLAESCKCSPRSVQNHLRTLAKLEYIRIVPHPEGDGPNTYALLFSSRVQSFLAKAGVDLAPVQSGPDAPLTPGDEPPSLPPSASSPSPVPSVSTSPEFAPPTQILQGDGGENSAFVLRDLRDQESPLSPLAPEHPGTSPHREGVRGGSFSTPAKRAFRPDATTIADDFEQLFSAWPRKQDRLSAFRTFASLARMGKLPPLAQLLDVVERFKTQDRAWRNGCVPNLRYWLQGHRWHDEIAPVSPVPVSVSGLAPMEPDEEARLRERVRAVQEKFQPEACCDAREKNDDLSAVADTFCALWPEEPRGNILARLLLAKLQGGSLADLARKALNWRGSPLPVADWFGQAAVC